MNESLPSPLICPVCGAPLAPRDKMVACANGHPFNRAKEGYVNLLLSHQRKSKTPGDDPEMIKARRRFFDSGAFDPLTERISNSPLFQREEISILDCGCGEGHVLGALGERHAGFFCGVDISKKAAQMASNRHEQATWIVANGMRDIPIADASMDVILSLLAPRNPSEFSRILRPNGALLIGTPGPNHLIQLREKLQFTARDFNEKADEAAAKLGPRFIETHRETLHYERALSQEQIADLIQMTPIFWRSSRASKAAVMELDQLTVTISFTLLTLTKA